MNSKRILILDDNQVIMETVMEALQNESFVVLEISYGYELLEATGDFLPDLILLDYYTVNTNVGELCKALKAEPAYHQIPVIIFSAEFNPADMGPGNCDGVLYMPFNPDELLQIILLQFQAIHDRQVG